MTQRNGIWIHDEKPGHAGDYLSSAPALQSRSTYNGGHLPPTVSSNFAPLTHTRLASIILLIIRLSIIETPASRLAHLPFSLRSHSSSFAPHHLVGTTTTEAYHTSSPKPRLSQNQQPAHSSFRKRYGRATQRQRWQNCPRSSIYPLRRSLRSSTFSWKAPWNLHRQLDYISLGISRRPSPFDRCLVLIVPLQC